MLGLLLRKGGCANWGRLPDFTQKTNKFGLGFTEETQKVVQNAWIRRPPVFISHSGVNAIEDEVEESEFDSWIYPTTDDGPRNWTAKDFVPISFITQ